MSKHDSSSEGTPIRVAYQGEPGAYSEKASRQLLGDSIRAFGLKNFEEVFKAVDSGYCDYGALPIENSLGGSIHANYDLLLRFNLHIIAELEFRVEHCLMVLPDVKREDVKMVTSHPQALAQCDGFIRKWGVQPKPGYDTAGSAKIIRDEGLRDTAAIASELAARTYGLKILASNIEDDETNFTRFLLVSRDPLPPPPNVPTKTSLVFAMHNHCGSLFRAQAAFALRDIDLAKIESRPAPSSMYLASRPASTTTSSSSSQEQQQAPPPPPPQQQQQRAQFQYMFYLDVLADVDGDACRHALSHLEEMCTFVRVLGCFPVRGTLPLALQDRIAAAPRLREERRKSSEAYRCIGIVGFGNFGQFLGRTLSKHVRVVATSRSDYTDTAKALGCEFVPGLDWEKFLGDYQPDVVLLAPSILSFRQTLSRIPPQLLEGRLVVDVLSVKEHPKQVMLELLPPSCDVLCTHPMFGPESGKHGWAGLPFMYDRVRIQDDQRCGWFLTLWDTEGCRMVSMTSEQHDRFAADTQFLTHLTGRILGAQGVTPTPIDTQGFQSLCELVRNTCADSFALFHGLYKYNSNSADQVSRLERSLSEVRAQLEAAQLSSSSSSSSDSSSSSAFEPHVSVLAAAVQPSKTVMIHSLTQQLQAQGESVLSLCVGEPDFAPAPEVLAALREAGDEERPLTRYTGVAGTLELRRAIADHLQSRKGIRLEEGAKQVLVSNGAKQSVYQAVLAVCGPGDDVIIPTPYWTSYPDITRLAGASVVWAHTTLEQGYILTAAGLEAALTPASRLLVLCNPCNPTGAVIPEGGLREIAAVVERHPKLMVLCDEIYERITYDTPHTSLASLPGMGARCITVNGFSKAYAMTGLRLGYLVGPPGVVSAATKLQSQITSCASSAAQHAGLAALALPQLRMDGVVEVFREKRDFALARLRDIPGLRCPPPPEGAFYLMPDVSAFFGREAVWRRINNKNAPASSSPSTGAGETKHEQQEKKTVIGDSDELCVYLLSEYGVAIVPGSAFGAPGAVRLSYATDMKTLKGALDGLQACLGCLGDGGGVEQK